MLKIHTGKYTCTDRDSLCCPCICCARLILLTCCLGLKGYSQMKKIHHDCYGLYHLRVLLYCGHCVGYHLSAEAKHLLHIYIKKKYAGFHWISNTANKKTASLLHDIRTLTLLDLLHIKLNL